ncbi:MAG: Heme A synthase, cytochrome oxidase biogenesis protein Cox15-CtaA [Cytophagales bacterium]|jgi:cytochrome c oxidase assembly protein subunit 15|nr:COX15/CtaA family protein [Bacteroidota bacterium]MBS1982111.1 COX15/CtaA family protein [Bacteroidota bacterium]WHZ06415.1 MAG: Heme A synthase, cytochrome oxidase biogenesis protein Cox15-CtaA [Cytophagales bacterium]
MNRTPTKTDYRPVAWWLYLGVIMLVVQIVLGGITRLTESGLSITEWNPITGVMPPLSETAWQAEFDKYKTTSQFQYIHADFKLSDFKKIFFWEWLHRNWARLMGLVFLAGFIYFLVKKKFSKPMVLPLLLLFFLGAIQGAIGWIMVKSGLVPERLFVGHVQLATHFMAALLLLAYTFWFALSLSVPESSLIVSSKLKNTNTVLIIVLFFQLIYGSFMAGLHTALFAPTWPSINGQWLPDGMGRINPVWENWINNELTIQFIHRGLAYLLLLLTIVWWRSSLKPKGDRFYRVVRTMPVLLVSAQVLLGIFTVVLSPYGNNLIYFGIAHQTVGILFMLSLIAVAFTVRKNKLKDVPL